MMPQGGGGQYGSGTNRGFADGDSKAGAAGFGVTQVKTGIDNNSSEEELFAPEGRIGVRTDIAQMYEEAPRPSADLNLPKQGTRNSTTMNR